MVSDFDDMDPKDKKVMELLAKALTGVSEGDIKSIAADGIRQRLMSWDGITKIIHVAIEPYAKKAMEEFLATDEGKKVVADKVIAAIRGANVKFDSSRW